MFRSILSKSLRDYRVPMLAWGIGLAVFMAAVVATATPAVVTAFTSFARIVSFLGDPYAMNTPEGYITFRYMATTLPLLLSIWPILAGARMVRGEEERGTMDVLLATSQTRTRLLLEKVGALAIALLVIAVLFALGVVAGEAALGGGHIDFVRALLAGLNLGLLAFFFGMVALLFSQLTASRRAAAGWASGLLILFVLLDMAGRELSGIWVQYLSPLYYYNLNRPLLASFPDQPLAVLVPLGLAVLCLVGSVILFARRDIGRPAFESQRERAGGTQPAIRSLSRAERQVSTRAVGLQTLYAEGWGSFWWLLGIVVFCAALLFVTPGFQKAFNQAVQQTPWLARYLYDTPTNTNAAMLGTLVFSFVPAVVMILALTLAMKWPSDLENGRLELIFSTPQSRLRVLLERYRSESPGGSAGYYPDLARAHHWGADHQPERRPGQAARCQLRYTSASVDYDGPGLCAGRTPALWRCAGHRDCLSRAVLPARIARREYPVSWLAHVALHLPPLRQPCFPRYELDQFSGHDRCGHRTADYRSRPIQICRR